MNRWEINHPYCMEHGSLCAMHTCAIELESMPAANSLSLGGDSLPRSSALSRRCCLNISNSAMSTPGHWSNGLVQISVLNKARTHAHAHMRAHTGTQTQIQAHTLFYLCIKQVKPGKNEHSGRPRTTSAPSNFFVPHPHAPSNVCTAMPSTPEVSPICALHC